MDGHNLHYVHSLCGLCTRKAQECDTRITSFRYRYLCSKVQFKLHFTL